MRALRPRILAAFAVATLALLAGCGKNPLEPPPPANETVCVWIGGQYICIGD